MRRPLLATAALLALSSQQAAAEGGSIRTGEHIVFSRVVLTIAPTTEWVLERGETEAIVAFPGRDLRFTTEDIWRRIPRTRVTEIAPERGADGTSVRIALGCDCFVTAQLVNGRYLAIDVYDEAPGDLGTAPGPADAAAQTATASDGDDPVADSLAAAERLLVEQVERAAEQGLIELTDPDALAELLLLLPSGNPGLDEAAEDEASRDVGANLDERAAEAEEAPEAPAAEAGTIILTDEDRLLAHLGLRLPGHEQVRATTVFDRDAPTPAGSLQGDTGECRPDEAIDLARWTDGRPLTDQMVDLRLRLVGEFDRPRPEAVRDLVRLHVRFGLGTEAGEILRGFASDFEDRELLADLARVVEGRPAVGPLARDLACPGRHGLWLALAGSPAALASETQFDSMRAAFEELPLDLRMLIAPDLVTRFVEVERLAEARAFRDIVLRPGVDPDRAMQLALGRLAAAERRFDEAEDWLGGLVERGAPNAPEATLARVRARLDARERVPVAWLTDLRALALEQRGGALELPARALLAESLAQNDDIREAMATLRALADDRPEARRGVGLLVPSVLTRTNPERAGRAAFAEAVINHIDLIPDGDLHHAARIVLAGMMFDLGLPAAALAVIERNADPEFGPARETAAEALIRLGRPEEALERLAGLETDQASSLRAWALALQDDFAAATAELASGPLEAVLPYAWAAGAWDIAAQSPDPRTAAMASFMRDRDEPGDLDATTPEDAFRTPPPAIGAPSLAAARGLVATGAELRVFLDGLLVEEE